MCTKNPALSGNQFLSQFRNLFCVVSCLVLLAGAPAWAFSPDTEYLADREALEEVQRAAFGYIWEGGHPVSGMAYEGSYDWEMVPVTVGGTGFGVAAIVVAADRGWVEREAALDRLLRMVRFLKDKSPRQDLHGAFPHWMNGETGEAVAFGDMDTGADIVETSFLIQGLLIARAYFNGPGLEAELREMITEIWEDVDWDWFTNQEENGLYWHWDPNKGFSMGLKLLGFNECLVTYVLAAASPTHPISRKAYTYWTSGRGYRPKKIYGYTIEASLPGAGPLFLTHYSFIGLDPRRMADSFVPQGYFVRNVKHVLSNRSYCLFDAPGGHRYGPDTWGLTASFNKDGYAASEPKNDNGTIAPTAALASMPYTPHYSMRVLQNLQGRLRREMWGPYGPYDAFSPGYNWYSRQYLAIDQLPIVSMIENYRSGLLWKLFMADPDVLRGLEVAGIHEPEFGAGFPEAVVTLLKGIERYTEDAYDIRRHPDTGDYLIPYWSDEAGNVSFNFTDPDGRILHMATAPALKGRNTFAFAPFMRTDGEVLTLTMHTVSGSWQLPVRLH